MTARVLRGRAWPFGDDISTDIILSGRYTKLGDIRELARHVMEPLDASFARKVRRGDMIVAGRNFGCGSSREQAPLALKAAGISAVAASSFARIFFRNAVNIGLPVVVVPPGEKGDRPGDRVELDLDRGELCNRRTGEVRRGRPLPPVMLAILEDGGLVPHVRRMLRARAGKGRRRTRAGTARRGSASGGG